MIRTFYSFPIDDIDTIKQQMLSWVNRFNICCFMDNHHYDSSYSSIECIVGAGVAKRFTPSVDFFNELSTFSSSSNDFVFGHLSYEVKDKIEIGLCSNNYDEADFPEFFFFIPEVVLKIEGKELFIGVLKQDPTIIFNEICNETYALGNVTPLDFAARITKQEYIETVSEIIRQIKIGNCYELNFCQEFYTYDTTNPPSVYQRLTQVSPTPFSAYYKVDDKYLLCASPERYIKKEGTKIISQPIKGTAPRFTENETSDLMSKQDLLSSEKERSENVMIVDLVRNDLSKVCIEASVTVEELCRIYSFPTVHQMISTVSGILDEETGFGEIVKGTFPMGSMTGAPKKRVMELIEQLEHTKRGIYSGSVGYIDPKGDFDLNVVIRSLVYNEQTNYLSFHVGSAITAYSKPEDEYEECLLKGKAMMKVFSSPVEIL